MENRKQTARDKLYNYALKSTAFVWTSNKISFTCKLFKGHQIYDLCEAY